MTEPVRVHVERPVIEGDTVFFRWSQPEPNPFQWRNEFFVRYDGVDLSAFSPLLFYDVFLALQLKVFAGYKRPVEVVFAEPVPHTTVAYWRAFHDADLVTVSPVSDAGSYSPWLKRPAELPKPRRASVFFGGGRDSMATTCLLSELYGSDEVLLIQFVMPLLPKRAQMEKLERRQENLMLRPARENLGVATHMVWTDYQAIFHGGGEKLRPHLELYTAGALPSLLWHGVSLATFCIAWPQYAAMPRAGGRLDFDYAKSRPEVLATQSTHYRAVLGADLTVTDLNLLYFILDGVAPLVKERYPHARDQIVMCTAGEMEERWCYRCKNCAWYGIYTIGVGYIDHRFDYDRVLCRSRTLIKLIRYAMNGVELSETGNAAPPPGTDLGLQSVFVHLVAALDPGVIAPQLSPEALGNLLTLKALYGNCLYPLVDALPARAIDLLGHPAAREVAALVAEHAEVIDEMAGPFARPGVIYDFGIRMPTRTAEVEHIRRAAAR